MYKIIITFYCFILTIGCGTSQKAATTVVNVDTPTVETVETDSFATPYFKMEVKANFITSDKLQQCYVVTPKNELIKYDATGKLLFKFNNNYLGDLKWVDTTDPFNLLLFYPDYLTVITLDRTLSKTGEYQLYDLNLVEINAIAMSNDNNLWLFDQTSSRITKVNRQGKIMSESGNQNLLLGSRLEPNFMLEHNNLLYVNDPKKGILVFDNFATYMKTIPIKGLQGFQILGQRLIFEEEGEIHAFHLRSLLTEQIVLPFPFVGGDQLRVEKDVLFLLRGGVLGFYKV